MATLLEFLTSPNPELDDYTSTGPPSYHDTTAEITLRPWTEFNYGNLLDCYGDILEQPPPNPPPNTDMFPFEFEIFDEKTLDHLLARTIAFEVNTALELAWEHCYRHHLDDIVLMSSGGRAGGRYRPDWAGIQLVQGNGPRRYNNRCAGDTKIARKWSSETIDHPNQEWPIHQIAKYCNHFRTRYGYLITDRELVVCRIFHEEIPDSDIARDRHPRVTQAPQRAGQPGGHGRHESMASRMSLDESLASSGYPSYPDDPAFEEEDAIENNMELTMELCSIPWENHGDEEELTVKLALWWIHMLAGAPGGEVGIGYSYPPLNAWVRIKKGYQHTSTKRITDKRPDNVISNQGSSQDPSSSRDPGARRNQPPTQSGRSATTSSRPRQTLRPDDPQSSSQASRSQLLQAHPVPSVVISTQQRQTMVAERLPTREEMARVEWDETEGQFWYQTHDGRRGWLTRGTQIWSAGEASFLILKKGKKGNPIWKPCEE